MPDDSHDAEWLLRPPDPGTVQFHIAAGEGIEMTPEIREAIEHLLETLQQTEVEGFRRCDPRCPSLSGCPDYICGRLYNCQPVSQGPNCAVHFQCVIADFRS